MLLKVALVTLACVVWSANIAKVRHKKQSLDDEGGLDDGKDDIYWYLGPDDEWYPTGDPPYPDEDDKGDKVVPDNGSKLTPGNDFQKFLV